MIIQYLLLLVLCVNVLTIDGMKRKEAIIQESSIEASNVMNLPKDIILKIFAWTDPESKKNLPLTCKALSNLPTKDILRLSPLVLTRRDLFHYMVQIAKEADLITFQNLVLNAFYCENVDIFDTASYFLPENSNGLELIQVYQNDHSAVAFEQALPCIMSIYGGEEKTIEQYKAKHEKQLHFAARNNTALETALELDHPTSVSELLLILDPTLLNNPGRTGNSCLLLATLFKKEAMRKFLLSFKDIEKFKISIAEPIDNPEIGGGSLTFF